MAIEKRTFSSGQDVADAIDSLGWFDDVELDASKSNRAVNCYIDSKLYLQAIVYLTGESQSYTPGVSFWTKGKNQSGSQVNETLTNTFRHKYCMITKNGIIFASHASAAVDYYSTWMLAKTNNEKIAVFLPNYNAVAGSAYKGSAVDETSSVLNSSGVRTCCPYYLTDGAWEDATQIVGYPLPTHPQSGVSYIKNGMGFVLCPRLTLGTYTINGTEYATNGVFALSDKD